MKLYHPTTELEEARIHGRGFLDSIIPFGHDHAGRLSIRVGVGFCDVRPDADDGRVCVEVEVPDDMAGIFEDSEPGDDQRYFYLPAKLATHYLRLQGQ